METFLTIIGALAALAVLVGVAAFGLSMMFSSWNELQMRRDELVASERSKKIAIWMRDAAWWFGRDDGSASIVLAEIAKDLERGGLFAVDQVRERCRASVKAAEAKPKEPPHA